MIKITIYFVDGDIVDYHTAIKARVEDGMYYVLLKNDDGKTLTHAYPIRHIGSITEEVI